MQTEAEQNLSNLGLNWSCPTIHPHGLFCHEPLQKQGFGTYPDLA